MEGNFSKIIPFVLLLGVIALMAGTMAIINAEFGETMTQCFNSSYVINAAGDACVNASLVNATQGPGSAGRDGQNITDQYYTKVYGQDALSTVGEQQTTIAIIVVMVIIIIALISVLGYLGLGKLR